VSEFSEHTKQQCERQIIEKHCSINDWVLYADLDEFQYYPKGLREHLDICNRYKLDFLEGRLLDRVSRDGSLISINFSNSIEEQFPLGGFITNPLLKAWDKKIVIARSKKIVGGGHHIFLSDTDRQTLPYTKRINKYSKNILIHHFKWDSLLLTRFNKYMTFSDPSLKFWKKEISRFLQYFSVFSGINVEDKKFKFYRVKTRLNI